jgi:PAS domain S-box-containing protein
MLARGEARDRLIVLASCALALAVSSSLDLVEAIHDYLNELEQFQADEVFTAFIVAAIGLVWYSRRRLKDFRRELNRRIAAEASLTLAEQRLALAVEAADVGLWDCDLETGRMERSHQLDEVMGWNAADLHTGEDFLDRVHPADAERVRGRVTEAMNGGAYRVEFRVLRPDGSVTWLESRGRVLFDGSGPVARPNRMAGTVMVVTDRVLSAERLKASLAEKETLLQEVHHRIKNNLQRLWSLIQLEKRRLGGGAVRDRLDALEGRIQVMGEIHKALYASENVSTVDIGPQLQTLCEGIRSISPRPELISIQVASDPLRCSLDTAIPLGMLVHEIVTNAVKHAFPEGRPGRISVSLRRAGDTVRLMASDDGQGDGSLESGEPGGGIGKQLIQSLSGQLCGWVTVSKLEGTKVTVEMPAGLFSLSDPNSSSHHPVLEAEPV